MRNTFALTTTERSEFYRLRALPGEAVEFWQKVAVARGLDPYSVISNGNTFTALSKGHGKQWCYPLPLKNKRNPLYKD